MVWRLLIAALLIAVFSASAIAQQTEPDRFSPSAGVASPASRVEHAFLQVPVPRDASNAPATARSVPETGSPVATPREQRSNGTWSTVVSEPDTASAIPLRPRDGTPGTQGAAGSHLTAPNGLSLSSLLASLAVVVVLILGIARLIIRRNPSLIRGIPPEAIDVLGRRTVDPRNSVYVVRVGSKLLLLGSSVNGLTALSEIADPIEVATMTNLCRAASASASSPSTWLQKLLTGRGRPVPDARPFTDRFAGDTQPVPRERSLNPRTAGGRPQEVSHADL